MTKAVGTKWSEGYVQVYTGEGKGKTTAALGVAIRAAGAGLRVFVAMFMKGSTNSELNALRRFADLIEVRQYGLVSFINGEAIPDDIAAARRGLSEVRAVIKAGVHKVVILDEACIVPYFKLCSVAELIELIELKPAGMELIFTGRRAPAMLLERADLVTEMRELKHYYSKGVKARTGIEK